MMTVIVSSIVKIPGYFTLTARAEKRDINSKCLSVGFLKYLIAKRIEHKIQRVNGMSEVI